MLFQPGDIILLQRPTRTIWGRIWISIWQFFTFFLFNRGLYESIDPYYHIMAGANWDKAISMEPPRCFIRDVPVNVQVYRLKTKPGDFDTKFYAYCNIRIGWKYGWLRFWAMMLDRIFHTRWFSTKVHTKNKMVCAQFVSEFYKELGVPCTAEDPGSAIPSDVHAYCRDNPTIWEEVT